MVPRGICSCLYQPMFRVLKFIQGTWAQHSPLGTTLTSWADGSIIKLDDVELLEPAVCGATWTAPVSTRVAVC